MSTALLDILPAELRFTVEANKQSSCSIQLANKTDQYVAFKVKTTSPKKYCVRPNVGIIKPNGTSDFTVTMQVQRTAPLDLQCKDKFLVQSTVVTSETVEEELTSEMFAKNSGRQVEERKLRVILVCSPQLPVLVPINGVANQDSSHEASQIEKVPSGVENLPPFLKEQVPERLETVKPVGDLRFTNDAGTISADSIHELARIKSPESRETKKVEVVKFPRSEMEDLLKKESEEYRSKIDLLQSKLAEAEQTVAKIEEEKTKALQERDIVKREVILVKRRLGGKTVHIGFPLLYICMVALICLTLGYLMQ